MTILQEEGWVVCRAFRKPTPSHQRPQGFEVWNHAYYARENSGLRLPISSVDFDEEKHMVNQNQPASFHNCFASAQELVSNNQSIVDHIQLTSEVLPQLDSPTISANLTTTNENFQHNSTMINDDNYDNERSNNSSQYIDWKNLENFLSSQLTDPITSFVSSDLPSVPQNYRHETQNGHFLGCFPDQL